MFETTNKKSIMLLEFYVLIQTNLPLLIFPHKKETEKASVIKNKVSNIF